MGDRHGNAGRPSLCHVQSTCRRWCGREELRGGPSCRCRNELVLERAEIALQAVEFAAGPEQASRPVRDRDVVQDRVRERVPRQRHARRHHSGRRDFARPQELLLTGEQGIIRNDFSFHFPEQGSRSNWKLCIEYSLFGWAFCKMAGTVSRLLFFFRGRQFHTAVFSFCL
jgi:hypothetical protein